MSSAGREQGDESKKPRSSGEGEGASAKTPDEPSKQKLSGVSA